MEVLVGDGWVVLFHGLLRKLFFVGHFSKTFAPPAMDQPYFNNEGVHMSSIYIIIYVYVLKVVSKHRIGTAPVSTSAYQ